MDHFQQPSDYSGLHHLSRLKKQGLSFTSHLIVTRPLFVPRRRRFHHVSGGNLRRFPSDHKSRRVPWFPQRFTNATTAEEPVPQANLVSRDRVNTPRHGNEQPLAQRQTPPATS